MFLDYPEATILLWLSTMEMTTITPAAAKTTSLYQKPILLLMSIQAILTMERLKTSQSQSILLKEAKLLPEM